MLQELRYAVFFTIATMILFGGIYPLALFGLGRAVFPSQASGSLIARADGTIAGSRLIAQQFNQPRYFQSRPSAVDYNAGPTGGSNLALSHPDYQKLVRDRRESVAAREGVTPDRVPIDLLTASGAGLDPHISPEAAAIQVNRVAAARRVAPEVVHDLVRAHLESPLAQFIGRPRINVLELNLALDAAGWENR